jgi:hypothetical protein
MKYLIAALVLSLSVAALAADQASPAVKLGKNGGCYERGTDSYRQTPNYQRFDSIDACVAAGGHLPYKSLGAMFGGTAAAKPAAAPPAATSAAAASSNSTPLYDTDANNIVKKARDGRCLTNAAAAFAETLHFAAFRDLKACLQSGGRE